MAIMLVKWFLENAKDKNTADLSLHAVGVAAPSLHVEHRRTYVL